MTQCKICKGHVQFTYDGKCPACMSVESIEVGQAEIDYINSLYDLVNTPLKDGELMSMFRDGKITESDNKRLTAVDSIINKLTATNTDIKFYKTPIAQLYNKYMAQIDSGEYSLESLANYGTTVGGQVVEIKSGVLVYKATEYYDEDAVEDTAEDDEEEE